MPPALTFTCVVGNPRVGSRTFQAAAELTRQLAAAARERGASVAETYLDLAEIAPRLFDWEDAVVAERLSETLAADLLVVASPTYKATYTGLLKAYVDRFPPSALEGKVAIPVMMGAAPIHQLAVELHLLPLLLEVGATCPVRGLYVLESQLPDWPQAAAAWVAATAAVLARALPALGAVSQE
jgi:FMN reductase